MRKESHSSISTYLDCQKKYELIYLKGLKVSNNHLIFGSMAHKVLETGEIPEEILYKDLKEDFNIFSWKEYFENIFNELKKFTKDYDIIGREVPVEDDYLKGIIDLVLKDKTNGRIVLCDYKFSSGVKSYEDLLLDEQLQIYAGLYCDNYKENLDNIDICYINIPKSQLNYPRVLTNGGLSRDKNQNTTYDMYIYKINELHLNVQDYKDILELLKSKKYIEIYKNRLDLDMLKQIYENIEKVLKDINKGYFLEKCTYQCKSCPFIEYCKYHKEIKSDSNSRSDKQ